MKRPKRRQRPLRAEVAEDVPTDDWVPAFVWNADAELRMSLMEDWIGRLVREGKRRVSWRRVRPRSGILRPTGPSGLILGSDGKPIKKMPKLEPQTASGIILP